MHWMFADAVVLGGVGILSAVKAHVRKIPAA